MDPNYRTKFDSETSPDGSLSRPSALDKPLQAAHLLRRFHLFDARRTSSTSPLKHA